MIRLYESNGCGSCRKVRKWLDENGLKYKAVNLARVTLDESEIRWLLQMAEDVYDVVSLRSLPVQGFKKKYGMKLEDLSFTQLISFLRRNPTAFRRPIVTNGKQLVAGFDEDELTVLLPKEKRESLLESKVEL